MKKKRADRIKVAVFGDPVKNLVVCDFGDSVTWIALPPEQALAYADAIRLKAEELQALKETIQ